MNVMKQNTLILAIGVSLFAVAALAQTPERTAPRTASKQPSDVIKAQSCYINMIDKITVAAGRGGVLSFVKPEEGHLVKADEEVAKVKDEVAAAQFATATKQAENEIEIKFAQKSAELAKWEYMRGLQANGLLAGTVTDIELKRLKLAWERADLQTENAMKEHDIAGSKRDEAGELLQTHVVETKIGGMVTKVYKRTGEAVREGDAIIDVVNTDRMRVTGYVSFAEVSRIRLGDPVAVNLDIKDVELPEEAERFEGKITFINVTVDGTTAPRVKVFAEVANRDGILRDGASAAMSISPRKVFAPANATTRRDVQRRPAEAE